MFVLRACCGGGPMQIQNYFNAVPRIKPQRIRGLEELRRDATSLLKEWARFDEAPELRGTLKDKLSKNANHKYVLLAAQFVHFDVLGRACAG